MVRYSSIPDFDVDGFVDSTPEVVDAELDSLASTPEGLELYLPSASQVLEDLRAKEAAALSWKMRIREQERKVA